MQTYTIRDLQAKFKELGYKWFNFHLVGIRSKDYVTNTFCDSFILYNGGQVFRFAGTTRPGSYYLLHLLNPKGTSILKPGQYVDAWALGKHKNEYEAWVQVKPITVYRDSNLNDKADQFIREDTGLFGIDIHRSSEFHMSKLVDKWSAGCQVFADPEKFAIFVKLSEGSKQTFFTYTLLDEWIPSLQ